MMSPKKRWLAAINMEEVDRLPFWPKLDGSYPIAQEEPFSKMDLDEIHNWIGSDQHIWLADIVKPVRITTLKQEKKTNTYRESIYKTASGDTKQVYKFDYSSQAWHPVEFPIKSRKDVEIMTEWYNDMHWQVDEGQLEKVRQMVRDIGEKAITCTGVGESPLMHFVEHLAGVENAQYLLFDHREEVEDLFAAMHKSLMQKTELITDKHPADLIYFVENTSTTLISPTQYKQYCFNHIQDYGELIEGNDRNFVLHMCGHLKGILADLAQLKASAFEAFTSPPVGNTTLLDGRQACSDKCLIGGTNASLWTHSAAEIIERIESDLDELPHHRGLVITSAGVMPPLCKPETIKEVCEWVKSYKCKV